MRGKEGLLQNNIYVLRCVWKYDRGILPLILANTLVTAVAPFIGILFPRQILDELLTARRPGRLGLLLLSFFLASSLSSYLTQELKGIFMSRPVRVTAPCMNSMYQKCMEISFQCTEDTDFLNHVETACKGGGRDNFDGISGMLHKWFEAPGAVIALCGYVALVSGLHVLVLFFLVCSVGVSYALSLAQKRYEHSRRQELAGEERRSEYLYQLMYDFSYGKEIRLYDLADWLGSRFMACRDKIRSIKEIIKKSELLGAWVELLLSLVREGIVYGYLVSMVAGNEMTVADFTMYAAAIGGFGEAFKRAARHLADGYGLSMQIDDYRSFMSRPDEMAQEPDPVPIPPAPYEFEFRDVSWRYPGSGHYVFRNLNLTIPKGHRLALVGHNGAGKSTFVKLLLRLYDVTEGEIFCNGINIRKFDRRAYYDLFSPIFQEVLPLGFSVADNIGVSDGKEIDRGRVGLCIYKAGLSDKINTLKYGADTCVLKIMDGEGTEFSGGEKQKLMIARALYKDGAVMLSDEPTAALDPLAEREIYESFDRLTENKTVVYVSHRLASTRFCDGIALFEEGRLAEYGTHEELMARNGKYAHMFHIQAKYYRQEGQGDEEERDTGVEKGVICHKPVH